MRVGRYLRQFVITRERNVENIVNTESTGVGVRVIAGERTGYAYSDDLSPERIRNAGALFLGRYTPEAVGDYVAGPNHVLPTSGSARFSSGLSVMDFLKRTSIVACDANSLRAIGPAAVTLAEVEGLGAHGLSVGVRLNIGRNG